MCISKQVEREFCGYKLPQEAVGFCEKLTEEANYNAMLSIGSFLRGEVQRRMRSAAVNVAHDLCQAWLKQAGFTAAWTANICRLLESWPRRPPETVVLPEKENPAGRRRPPFHY